MGGPSVLLSDIWANLFQSLAAWWFRKTVFNYIAIEYLLLKNIEDYEAITVLTEAAIDIYFAIFSYIVESGYRIYEKKTTYLS